MATVNILESVGLTLDMQVPATPPIRNVLAGAMAFLDSSLPPSRTGTATSQLYGSRQGRRGPPPNFRTTSPPAHTHLMPQQQPEAPLPAGPNPSFPASPDRTLGRNSLAQLPPLSPDNQHQPQYQQQQRQQEPQQQQQQQYQPQQQSHQQSDESPASTARSHPWVPKRKPPSAFFRRHPLVQHEAAVAAQQSAKARAAKVLNGVGGGGHQGQGLPFQRSLSWAHDPRPGRDGMYGGGGGPEAAAGSSNGVSLHWGASSVADLEALDAILDSLVVLDTRVRAALLAGPPISCETVVPDPSSARPGAWRAQQPEDLRDRTFLTSVKVVEEVDQQREEAAPPALMEVPLPAPQELLAMAERQSPQRQSPPQTLSGSMQRVSWAAAVVEDGDPNAMALFQSAIPVTVPPGLMRTYIASKMVQHPKLPPLPPPTMDHLLRTRPPPFIDAPSYEDLCVQIRDVQRQYTCGTTGGRPAAGTTSSARSASPPAHAPSHHQPMTTANMYISGLDGPTLNEVVTHTDLPVALERSRPSFVALKPRRASSRHHRRSLSPVGSRLLAAKAAAAVAAADASPSSGEESDGERRRGKAKTSQWLGAAAGDASASAPAAAPGEAPGAAAAIP